MQINFTARHFKAPDKLKKFSENEISRLQKFYDGIIECDIILDFIASNHSKHIAEIILKVYGQVLSVSKTSDDMYKSIDLAVQKLERMLKKYKAHLRSFNREKAGTIAVNRIPLYEEE